MTKILLALGLTFAASSAAFADSSALDTYWASPSVSSMSVDYTATASTGAENEFEMRAKLGDGSPMYSAEAGGAVDFAPTASTGTTNEFVTRNKLGDGSPMYN